MSAKELSRLEVVQRLDEVRLTQQEAAGMLGVGVRQVKRLLRVYREVGANQTLQDRLGSFACCATNAIRPRAINAPVWIGN